MDHIIIDFYILKEYKPDAISHPYNPNYSEDRLEDCNLRPARQKVCETPFQTTS
jgi:hypothetical protein